MIGHLTRRITQGVSIVKGWKDKRDRGCIQDTSRKNNTSTGPLTPQQLNPDSPYHRSVHHPPGYASCILLINPTILLACLTSKPLFFKKSFTVSIHLFHLYMRATETLNLITTCPLRWLNSALRSAVVEMVQRRRTASHTQ